MYINGVEAKNYFPVKNGDIIRVELTNTNNENIKMIKHQLEILYEDEWILIVKKEHNLAVQPSIKHFDDNLVSRVLGYFESKNEEANCHILTRLDYPTSGIVVIAKNAFMHNMLAKTHILKKYYAKTTRELPERVGNICLPIARDYSSNIKRKVDFSGKDAHTRYELIEHKDNTYFYDVTLLTGRTHQIRVHFAYYNCPIIGDKLYGGDLHSKLLLQCYLVEFIHPISSDKIRINLEPEL